MVKPPRPVWFESLPPRPDFNDPEPRSAAAVSKDDVAKVGDVRAEVGDKGRASAWRETDAQALPLDLAIEAALASKDVDAVTRISLNEMRASIAEADPRAMLASLYNRNLAQGLLSFVMPRLRHPEVLRAENHDALLERLADIFSARAENSAARAGVFALQQELRRLNLLRRNRNSLIEG